MNQKDQKTSCDTCVNADKENFVCKVDNEPIDMYCACTENWKDRNLLPCDFCKNNEFMESDTCMECKYRMNSDRAHRNNYRPDINKLYM